MLSEYTECNRIYFQNSDCHYTQFTYISTRTAPVQNIEFSKEDSGINTNSID